MNKKELDKKYDELIKRNNQLVKDINKIRDEIVQVSDKIMEVDPKFVKVECTECNGDGYTVLDNNKKHKCKVCLGKQYIWLRRYNEE